MKLKSAICTVLLWCAINKVDAQTLDDVVTQGNTTTQQVFINTITVNPSNSVMNLGRANYYYASSNSYLYGYKNDVNTYNATIVGYENNLLSGQSGSVFGKYNKVAGHAPMVFGYRNYLNEETDKSIAVGRDNTNYGYVTTTIGNRNIIYGSYSLAFGNFNTSDGTYSTALGSKNKVYGTNTTAVGFNNLVSGTTFAGSVALGNGNSTNANYAIAVGLGINNAVSNSLMIGVNDNSKMTFLSNGNVLIAKTTQAPNSTYKLDVNGTIRANKVVVNTTGADFVFDSTYNLLPLQEVETFIQQNKHLPNIPSATEMQKNGLDMGDQQTKLLQKVEELTLYLIEQSKKIEQLQSEINALKKKKKK